MAMRLFLGLLLLESLCLASDIGLRELERRWLTGDVDALVPYNEHRVRAGMISRREADLCKLSLHLRDVIFDRKTERSFRRAASEFIHEEKRRGITLSSRLVQIPGLEFITTDPPKNPAEQIVEDRAYALRNHDDANYSGIHLVVPPFRREKRVGLRVSSSHQFRPFGDNNAIFDGIDTVILKTSIMDRVEGNEVLDETEALFVFSVLAQNSIRRLVLVEGFPELTLFLSSNPQIQDFREKLEALDFDSGWAGNQAGFFHFIASREFRSLTRVFIRLDSFRINIAEFEKAPCLANLEEFGIEGGELILSHEIPGAFFARVVKNINNLRVLSVRNTGTFDDNGLDAALAHSSLDSLYVDGTAVTDEGLLKIAASPRKWKALSLGSMPHVTLRGLEALFNSSAFSQLEQLVIYGSASPNSVFSQESAKDLLRQSTQIPELVKAVALREWQVPSEGGP